MNVSIRALNIIGVKNEGRSCPAQWTGRDADSGDDVEIRYRWGVLTITRRPLDPNFTSTLVLHMRLRRTPFDAPMCDEELLLLLPETIKVWFKSKEDDK